MPLALVADGAHLALPPHRVMLEVPGPVDRAGLDLMRELRDEGYRVIVGDVEICEHPPQTARLAAGVRVDARDKRLDELVDQVLRWNPRSQILVSGLADDATIERCKTLGVTWMRGDVLRAPDTVDEPTVPTHRLALLQLLAELERPDVDFDDIDRLVSVDLGMSYKILRMANSSYLALERRVERTRDAVVYLGIDTVRAAAALLALSEASDHPPEIVHLSLVRARHCEEVMRARRPEFAHAAFTTGLFSTLDVLLGLTDHDAHPRRRPHRRRPARPHRRARPGARDRLRLRAGRPPHDVGARRRPGDHGARLPPGARMDGVAQQGAHRRRAGPLSLAHRRGRWPLSIARRREPLRLAPR